MDSSKYDTISADYECLSSALSGLFAPLKSKKEYFCLENINAFIVRATLPLSSLPLSDTHCVKEYTLSFPVSNS